MNIIRFVIVFQCSLEYPGNIPIVISTTCILYQTKAGGCQEELPLELGHIVTGIFKNQNWVYVQTPHGEEGYVLHKYCMPLCALPVRRNIRTSGQRDNFATWKIYEDLDTPHEKTYDSGLANLASPIHRNFVSVLADSEPILLDCNRNQMNSEDVLDYLNGNVLSEEVSYYPSNGMKTIPQEQSTISRNNRFNAVLADFVENEIFPTENVTRFENDRLKCECALMDGVSYTIEADTEVPVQLFSSHYFDSYSNTRDADFVSCDHLSKNPRICSLGDIENTCLRQSEVSYKTASKGDASSLIEEKYNRISDQGHYCICCSRNYHIEKDAISELDTNISKDFKSPRHSSTPIGKSLLNPINNRSSDRKIKKHCSTHYSHENFKSLGTNYEECVGHDHETVFPMDKIRNKSMDADGRSPYTPPRQNYSLSKGDLYYTSQQCKKPITKTNLDNLYNCVKSDNFMNIERDYKFQTIEILQESENCENNVASTSTNRIKKPCFKTHSKIEHHNMNKSKSANGLYGLENIVEDGTEERFPQNRMKNSNHTKCNTKGSKNNNQSTETPSELNLEPIQAAKNDLDQRTGETGPFQNKKDWEIMDIHKTVDTLSTASYPLQRRSKSNRSSSDTQSLRSEKTIDELYIKYQRRSRKKSVDMKKHSMGMKQNKLMLITDDYRNEDDKFQVTKDEIVVLINVYKSWLYVQTDKQQNGFIPSYIAAYAVV